MRILGILVVLALAGYGFQWQKTGIQLRQAGSIPSDGTILGAVSDLDVLPNGNILVLDGQAKELLVFSPDGNLVRTLGREGEGPGEIKGATEVEVSPDGRIVLLDPLNTRFSVWTDKGELLPSIPIGKTLGLGMQWPHAFFWSSAGPVVKVTGFFPGTPMRFLLLDPGLEAIRDTIVTVTDPEHGPTGQFSPYTVTPEGKVLAAKGDTLYLIRVLGRGGEPQTVFTRDDLPAQRMTEGEVQQFRRNLQRMPIPSGTELPEFEMPEFHHRFVNRSLDVDSLGRLWACPSTISGSASSFDVFGPAGDLIESVQVPEHILGFRIRASKLLAIGESPLGEPMVHIFEIR